jgi:hypothetical protein
LTAAEEEREEWRQEDFRTEFLPVQRAQLRIVSQSYEVSAETFGETMFNNYPPKAR